MGRNVNCQYCDRFYRCLHKDQKKVLGIFKTGCIKLEQPFTVCSLEKEYPRPNFPMKTKNKIMSLRLKKDRIIINLKELIEEAICIDDKNELENIVVKLENLYLTEDI